MSINNPDYNLDWTCHSPREAGVTYKKQLRSTSVNSSIK